MMEEESRSVRDSGIFFGREEKFGVYLKNYKSGTVFDAL
jgi:hypothetical protein